MKYKIQIPSARITVQRVTYDDPVEIAAATERWNSSASMMLELLERYEAQAPETPIFEGAMLPMLSEHVNSFRS